MQQVLRIALKALLTLLALSGTAQAACNFANGTHSATYSMNIGQLTVQRDPAPGTVLFDSGPVTTPNTSDIHCSTGSDIYRGYWGSDLVQVYNNYTYQTNIPGIGIAVAWSHLNEPLDEFARAFHARVKEGSPAKKNTNYFDTTGTFRVKLIATGEPITSGMLDLTPFTGSRDFSTDHSVSQLKIEFNPATVNVTNKSCQLQSKSITVPLGDVQGYQLRQVGNTISPVDFSVELDCDQGTNIDMIFNGTTLPGENTILQLNNLQSPTSAQGVGIQILSNSQPLTFGELRLLMSNSPQGHVSVPFQARVIRSADALKAGEIDATATFEMVYR